MTGKRPKRDDVEAINESSRLLLDYITRTGWASVPDLLAFSKDNDIDPEILHKSLRALDRQKLITARPGPDGKTHGWESLLGKGTGRKRYGALSAPLRFTMVLITPALGQLSTDDTNFTLARDIDGNIVFTPAQCRAMLHKAYRLSGFGADTDMSESAVNRISVAYRGCQSKGPIVWPVKRRPVNREGKAVGVLLHEGVPSGSTIEWELAYPTTHFTRDQFTVLLSKAEQVGFSPAGSGEAGGNHGLFRWVLAAAGEESAE